MALRSLVMRMRSPAAATATAVLRLPPDVSRSLAAETRRFSTASRLQGERGDIFKMKAIRDYKFNLNHLENVERHLDNQRRSAEIFERANKYIRGGLMYIILPLSILRVALVVAVQALMEPGFSTPPTTRESD